MALQFSLACWSLSPPNSTVARPRIHRSRATPVGPWPTFDTQAELQASPWGAYYQLVYGELPPDNWAGWYPLYIAWFNFIHDDALVTAHVAGVPDAKTCPDQAWDRYSLGAQYEPPSVSWIWQAYPYPAAPDEFWLEVIHEADPFGDEHDGMWMIYAPGSGIYFYTGKTIAFNEHADAYSHFGAKGNEDLSRKAYAAGYDSIQFLAHVDHVNYQCDTFNTGKPGFDYMGVEIVSTWLVGTFACGAAGATPNVFRSGLADSGCVCDNGKQFLNCAGVPPIKSLGRRRSNAATLPMPTMTPLTTPLTTPTPPTLPTPPTPPRFKAVWNCPYLGSDVVGRYGLTANPRGTFNGSVITLLYGPSTWPRLAATQNPDVSPCWTGIKPCTWNQSLIWSNISVVSNGGVPQAGDIDVHRAGVQAIIEQLIPDPRFNGYGIFDWEDWRALYSENDDGLSYNNHYSVLLVKRQHPTWTNETRIALEAKRQYDAAARLFFTETLRTAKRLRPRAKFGFYEYPMAAAVELLWLWREVGVLAASDYGRSAASTAASVNQSLTALRMAEEAAVANGSGATFVRPDVLIYVWLWPGARPVDTAHLDASVRVPAAMGADGIILWGASADAHAAGYAETVLAFLNQSVGPLLEACAAERAACSASACSAHGRCSSYEPAHPDRGCTPASPTAAGTCLCDAGWRGERCDTPLALPRRAD